MTSHELARKLLENPDLPVQLYGETATDTLFCDVGENTLNFHEDRVLIRGWASDTKMLIE
jgi:hypothetical protein